MATEIEIYRKDGPSSRTVWARLHDDGAVGIDTQDLGTDPEELLGTDEYEFSYTVSANQRDALLLALLRERFGQDSGGRDFEAFCKANGIDAKFWSWR